jgi:hypothetical protein
MPVIFDRVLTVNLIEHRYVAARLYLLPLFHAALIEQFCSHPLLYLIHLTDVLSAPLFRESRRSLRIRPHLSGNGLFAFVVIPSYYATLVCMGLWIFNIFRTSTCSQRSRPTRFTMHWRLGSGH